MMLVSGGDRAAYGVLVDRHADRMIRMAQRTVGSRQDAEDIVQDAFIRIWTHAGQWEPGRAKLTTWSYRIVMNRFIAQQRRPRSEPLGDIDERPDPTPDAMESLYRTQMAQHVATAMAGLPVNQRAAIALCYYEELSNIEAAEILSVTVGAVESLLVRGRRQLREALQVHLTTHEGSSGVGRYDA
jgi:RNA polymerase sigma-70 factor (ECF subfamily)